jgi:hypothetical protein
LYAASDEERKAWMADLDKSIKGTHSEDLKASGKGVWRRRKWKCGIEFVRLY